MFLDRRRPNKKKLLLFSTVLQSNNTDKFFHSPLSSSIIFSMSYRDNINVYAIRLLHMPLVELIKRIIIAAIVIDEKMGIQDGQHKKHTHTYVHTKMASVEVLQGRY